MEYIHNCLTNRVGHYWRVCLRVIILLTYTHERMFAQKVAIDRESPEDGLGEKPGQRRANGHQRRFGTDGTTRGNAKEGRQDHGTGVAHIHVARFVNAFYSER